jgi:hypothetical protein
MGGYVREMGWLKDERDGWLSEKDGGAGEKLFHEWHRGLESQISHKKSING